VLRAGNIKTSSTQSKIRKTTVLSRILKGVSSSREKKKNEAKEKRVE